LEDAILFRDPPGALIHNQIKALTLRRRRRAKRKKMDNLNERELKLKNLILFFFWLMNYSKVGNEGGFVSQKKNPIFIHL
jgi:hypothetical protein